MTPRLRILVLALALVATAVVSATPTAQATGPCSAAASQAAAQKYLDALLDRDLAWSVPLHPEVVRYENGLLTAITDVELRLDLYLHLQHTIVQGIEDVDWTYQPGGRVQVINANYHIPVGLPGLIIAGSTVDEDFTLTTDCRIKHIDVTFTVEQPA